MKIDFSYYRLKSFGISVTLKTFLNLVYKNGLFIEPSSKEFLFFFNPIFPWITFIEKLPINQLKSNNLVSISYLLLRKMNEILNVKMKFLQDLRTVAILGNLWTVRDPLINKSYYLFVNDSDWFIFQQFYLWSRTRNG